MTVEEARNRNYSNQRKLFSMRKEIDGRLNSNRLEEIRLGVDAGQVPEWCIEFENGYQLALESLKARYLLTPEESAASWALRREMMGYDD